MKDTDMSFISWMKSCFSNREKALAMYRSGMVKAKNRDYSGAIADYSDAIQVPRIPADVKAMAIYNRALVYSAICENAQAVEDLAVLLEMPGVPANIKTRAQERWERIRQRNAL